VPTYKNATSNQVYRENILWQPGETKGLLYFVPHSALGLTKLSDTPAVAPQVLLSEEREILAGGSEVIAVPYAPKVKISAIATEGEAVLSFGEELEVPLNDVIYYDSPPLAWDRLESFTLSSDDGAKVQVLIEEVL